MSDLRQEVKDLVSTCDILISSHAQRELTPAERAIVDYYLREMPSLLMARKTSGLRLEHCVEIQFLKVMLELTQWNTV